MLWHHILIKLNLYSINKCTSRFYFRLTVLRHGNIHFQLGRGNWQPFGISGFITLFLELHLPKTLGHVPTIVSVLVSEERIFLRIFFGIPFHYIFMHITIHILYNFLIETSCRYTFKTVCRNAFINIT